MCGEDDEKEMKTRNQLNHFQKNAMPAGHVATKVFG